LSKFQRDQLDDAWGKQNRENKDIRGWKGLIFILKRETAAVLEQNIFPQMEVFAVPVVFLFFFIIIRLAIPFIVFQRQPLEGPSCLSR
jgi:hypothetical protein